MIIGSVPLIAGNQVNGEQQETFKYILFQVVVKIVLDSVSDVSAGVWRIRCLV